MPVTHVAIAVAGTPVDGSTLEALVAAATDGRLVEPAADIAGLGVHQVQGVGIVVLCGEVGLASVRAGLVEVPAGNDVGLGIGGGEVDVLCHVDGLFRVGVAVAPVGEGHQAFVLVGGQHDLDAFLVHPLAVNDIGLRTDDDHVVVGAVDGQLQLVGVHLLEVGGQRLVAVEGVLELSLGGNLLAGGIGPVHEVVAEVLGGGQLYLGAGLVLVGHGIDVDAAALCRSRNGCQRVHVDSGLGAVEESLDDDIAEAAFLAAADTHCGRQRQGLTRGQRGLLLGCQRNLYMVGIVAVAGKLVLVGALVGTRRGVVAQRDGLALANLGGNGDAVLGIGAEALNPHAHLGRGEGESLGGLHHPLDSLCRA